MLGRVRLVMRLLVFVGGLLLPPAAIAVTIDWVTVGGAGNKADTEVMQWDGTTGYGAVRYTYRVSKYEVTKAQYVEFLNAVAATDPYSLYDWRMPGALGGITRSGSSGSYTYSATAGRENMPVNYVTFWSGLRFANWLHNGQGNGDTETGAYTLGGVAFPSDSMTIERNDEARVFLPSEDEWYKAAYYDVSSASYFDYAAGSDAVAVCASPGATVNTANCSPSVGDLTDVGSYTGSVSPNGTFDQGGNVWEWNDSIYNGANRSIRGGGFSIGSDSLGASTRNWDHPSASGNYLGFRVASLVPEPAKSLFIATGMLGFAAWRRRLH